MVEKIRVTDISDRERFWFYYNNQLFTVIHNCLKIFTNYIFFPYAFFIIKYKIRDWVYSYVIMKKLQCLLFHFNLLIVLLKWGIKFIYIFIYSIYIIRPSPVSMPMASQTTTTNIALIH